MVPFYRLIWLLALLGNAAFALNDTYRTLSEQTPAFQTPQLEGEPRGYLPKDTRVRTVEARGSAVRLWSRSRESLWVAAKDLRKLPHHALQKDVEPSFPALVDDFKRIRLDLGAAGGSEGPNDFLEVALGIEYFMMERLSLRSSLFYRRSEFRENFLGLDVSVRGNGRIPLGALRLRGIIGAGYRFPSLGRSVPIVEVGGFAELVGFDLGLMLKFVPHATIHGSGSDVVVYSVVFSGTAGYL